MKKSICFVAQFPPPIHGLSKAVDTLYNSDLKEEYNLKAINITDNKKFLLTAIKLIKDKSNLYYFTISQSKSGNIRDLILLKIMNMKKKKVVLHLHGGYYRNMLDQCSSIQKNLNLKLLSKTSASIALGNSLRYIFEGIIDDKNIYVVPNCIDDEFYISDREFEEKISRIRRKEILQILYLSNFIEEKGYKELLEVAKILNDSNMCKYKFVFAGKFFNSEDEKYFNEFIKYNKLEEIVEYKGIVKGNEKKNLLKESDVFFLLTRYKNEGQPISIIEGMGNGLCIVTTNHAGIPDLVNDKENGFIVSYDDYDSMIYNIKTLQENKKILIDIAYKNRAKVERNFKEKHYINNMKNVFSEVIHNES
ncbi:MAG: glycosyltransferase family 4 protein [Paeniclostridium sordellii]|nr:glycosyltransferase family 4 protein [Paeniclostridium sordellii]